MIIVNLDKAKEIWKDKLRGERAPLLAKLDVEYMIATEKSQTARKKEVADKKQQLRDITSCPELENATTLDEIKAVNIPVEVRG